MKVIRDIKELVSQLRKLSGTIGFVPTMGALHDGHKSLIRASTENNDVTIVSIFVNPTQFLPNEDLQKYPRTEELDINLCQNCGVDFVFLPSVEQMYPKNDIKIMAPQNYSSIFEGATRKGHFDGVLTVLNKFFNIIRPTNVYFGKKDAQQLIIVQNFIKTTFSDINVVACDIKRSSDGLALSSRNVYLNEEEKLSALKLFRSLKTANKLIDDGLDNSDTIIIKIKSILEPLKIDYVAITNRNLENISKVEKNNTLILIAVYVGTTRLIDNLWI